MKTRETNRLFNPTIVEPDDDDMVDSSGNEFDPLAEDETLPITTAKRTALHNRINSHPCDRSTKTTRSPIYATF
jgi:hypothetical protein